MDETFDERIHEVEALATPEEQIPAAMELESDLMAESWGILPLYAGPQIMAAKDGLANLTPEPYTGLDLFGSLPVEQLRRPGEVVIRQARGRCIGIALRR